MADEQRTVIRGKLVLSQKMKYGAINALEVLEEDPSDWELKFFMSVEELTRYAADNQLIILEPKNE